MIRITQYYVNDKYQNVKFHVINPHRFCYVHMKTYDIMSENQCDKKKEELRMCNIIHVNERKQKTHRRNPQLKE